MARNDVLTNDAGTFWMRAFWIAMTTWDVLTMDVERFGWWDVLTHGDLLTNNTGTFLQKQTGTFWQVHGTLWPVTGRTTLLSCILIVNLKDNSLFLHLLAYNMMQFIVIFIRSVLFILMWVWWCGHLRGRAVMHYARPSLFIFAVLSAVLRSGFRDTD